MFLLRILASEFALPVALEVVDSKLSLHPTAKALSRGDVKALVFGHFPL